MQSKLDLYERVAPLAGLGIWEGDFKAQNFTGNSVVRQILEVSEDYQLTRQSTFRFYDEPEVLNNLINLAISKGVPQSGELKLTTDNGTQKWVRVRVNALLANGKCETIFGTLEDITEQIQLLNNLIEKEARFSAAFDHAPIGMALVSPVGGWIKVNYSLCKLLGYKPAEFVKRTFQDFTHPDDLDSDLKQMQQLLQGEITSYSMEKRYFHHDGHIIWAHLSVAMVRSSTGDPLYFISQVKDISERKKHMETIRSQNERLLSFAHIISHNLRSHTGNMRMLTNMIVSEPDATEREQLVGLLDTNAGNMLETLEHLNEVVRIQDAGMVGVTELNLHDQVSRVLNILAGSLREANARVEVDIANHLLINYNAAYLESIVINLVTNSLKYKHPERTPVILISARQDVAQVMFSLRDNGQGIDLKLHGHKLFGMYKTFHQHADSRGLGLFLVKNHVEAMGGSIRVESEPGNGSVFNITILR